MCPITARGIERWNPRLWDEVVGNADLKATLRGYVSNSPVNTLVTGAKRTGKTRTLLVGIKALVCQDLQEEQNPCGNCAGCIAAGRPLEEHIELFRGGAYGILHIDCNSVSAKELRDLSMKWEFDSEKIIIYLDEVADLGKDGRDKILMKPIDEWRCTWFASATKVTKPKDKQGRPRRGEGLSGAVINRFANLLTTSLPNPEQLDGWIRQRCLEWKIEIDQEAATIQRLIERSHCRLGHVKQPIAVAASAGRVLTLERVETFNFRPLE